MYAYRVGTQLKKGLFLRPMALLSIKLKIGEREYPMRVEPEEEELLRQAGSAINEHMKFYQKKYAKDDKQDLLAIVAIDLWMSRANHVTASTDTEAYLEDKLSEWDGLLSQALTKD
jgi:cell division protein ZapA